MQKLLFLSLFWFFTNSQLNSQWIKVQSPYQFLPVSVRKMNLHHLTQKSTSNNEVYIQTNFGLYKNDDPKGEWKLVPANGVNGTWIIKGDSLINDIFYYNLNDLNSAAITIMSNLVVLKINNISYNDTCFIFGSDYTGCSKSMGYSDQWQYKNNGLPRDSFIPKGGTYWIHYTHVNSLSINNNYVYAGTHRGVYKTHIDSFQWRELKNGITSDEFRFILSTKDILLAANLSNQLFISQDNGASWKLNLTSNSRFTSLNYINDTFFITTNGAGIIYSVDRCKTWNSFNKGLSNLSVNTISNFNGTLICGVDNSGFFYFNGTEWILNNKGIQNNIEISNLQLFGSDSILIVSNGNLTYKSKYNDNWDSMVVPQIKNHPELKTQFFSILSYRDTLLAIYGNNSSGIYTNIAYSLDYGNKWFSYINPADSNKIYYLAKDNEKLYLMNSEHLYYSNGFGYPWKDISFNNRCKNLKYLIIKNSTPYMLNGCANDYNVYKYIQDIDWQQLPNNSLSQVAGTDFLGYWKNHIFTNTSSAGLYESSDDGGSWNQVKGFIKGAASKIVSVGVGTDKLLFFGGAAGVYFTENGFDWTSLNNGLPNIEIRSMQMYRDTLYVGTNNGLWKRGLGDFKVTNVNTSKNNSQAHIFPNPTSEEVNIIMNNDESYFLNCYDLTGKCIFNSSFKERIQIQVQDMHKGIYLLRIFNKTCLISYKLIVE